MEQPSGVVHHAPDRSRYELVADGEVVAIAEYRDEGNRLVMHHTYTEPQHRGRGYAAQLVAGALDDIRVNRGHVLPTCWFVAEFIDGHPEYRELLATG